MSDMECCLVVCVVLVTGRAWLGDEAYRWLPRACGGVILLLGVLFIGLGGRLLGKGAGPDGTEVAPPAAT